MPRRARTPRVDRAASTPRRRRADPGWSAARGSVSDPVLRILVAATLICRVGRGIFLTVTVLYFTLIVGLAPHEVAIVLGAASAAGIVASLAADGSPTGSARGDC